MREGKYTIKLIGSEFVIFDENGREADWPRTTDKSEAEKDCKEFNKQLHGFDYAADVERDMYQ